MIDKKPGTTENSIQKPRYSKEFLDQIINLETDATKVLPGHADTTLGEKIAREFANLMMEVAFAVKAEPDQITFTKAEWESFLSSFKSLSQKYPPIIKINYEDVEQIRKVITGITQYLTEKEKHQLPGSN